MNRTKIIKTAYIFLTLYAFYALEVTSLKMIDLLPGIILMWSIYAIFVFGNKASINTSKSYVEKKIEVKRNLFDNMYFVIFIITMLLVSTKYVISFYTGQTMTSIFTNIIKGNFNFYRNYQRYFDANQISSFSLSKIPYVIMLFFIKFILFITYIEMFLMRKKPSKQGIILLFIATTSHLLFAVARGTNLEFFEIGILIIFIIVNKNKEIKLFNLNKKTIFVVFFLLLLATLFYNRIQIRTGSLSFYQRPEYSINENSIFVTLFGKFAVDALFFYDYFLFGLYFTSRFITEIVLLNIQNLFSVNFPRGLEVFSNINVKNLMLTIAPRRNRWYPNIVEFSDKFGALLLIAYVFVLGYINNKSNRNSIFDKMLKFFIFLQMFTFPIGNLLFISSASSLSFYITIIIYTLDTLGFRIKFKTNNTLFSISKNISVMGKNDIIA